jgi:hypothetical protein
VLKQGMLVKGLIALVVAIAIAACVLVGGVSPKDLASWLIPVVGTYYGASYGASYAFKLQQDREEVAADRAKVGALNHALMVMCFQYNEIASIWRHMRTFDVGELPRMINYPAYQPPQFDYRQNVVELAFLMHSGNASLLLDLSVEQGRFDTCMESMKIRSEYVINSVEPLIEQHGFRAKLVNEELVYNAFGERVFHSIRNLTNSLFDHFRNSEASLFEMIGRLHTTAKQCYPDEKFFKVDRVDTDPARSSGAPPNEATFTPFDSTV